MRSIAQRILAAVIAIGATQSLAAAEGLAPFVAEYEVRYGGLMVGSSQTEVARGVLPGQWTIVSQSNASGFAKLLASGTLEQRSSFAVEGAMLRPSSYRFDDGTKKTGRDVILEFDWGAGRVNGVAEDEPVAIASESGLQDAASIQALVPLRLRAGIEPGTIAMIEKDRIKRYRYTQVRRERLKTAIGELDTVVYRSARDGSSRETLSWFAPSLGFLLVKAEQLRDGERSFHTTIRRFEPGG